MDGAGGRKRMARKDIMPKRKPALGFFSFILMIYRGDRRVHGVESNII
jgi:hypothetical protein